jgi:hypothetical protein
VSEYPAEAVELSLTVLVPVTDENRSEVDGVVIDLLQGAGLTWWFTKLAHYNEQGLVVEYGYKRPLRWTRPRPRRKSKGASA